VDGPRWRIREGERLEVNLAGVTFEGRQEALAGVRRGTPVLLEREPSNAYDPNAVAVRTLDGVSLGYVPKAWAPTVVEDVSLGRIIASGELDQAPHSRWARIECAPTTPALVFRTAPPHAAGDGEDARALWESRLETLPRRGRCGCCGSAAPPPLTLAPMWTTRVERDAAEAARARLELTGACELCSACERVRNADARAEHAPAVVAHLRRVNRLTEEQAAAYLGFARAHADATDILFGPHT